MKNIDFLFPFFVFGYGVIMVALTSPWFLQLVAKSPTNSPLVRWFASHRALGLTCFFVGFFWSLQRIILL